MRKKSLFLLLFLFVSSSCTCLNTKDDNLPSKKIVTGYVYLSGSEVGINDIDGHIFALAAEDDTLKKIGELQNKVVTVKGYVDTKIKYPQRCIIVEEYKQLEATEIIGRLNKEGRFAKTHYTLQAPEKTYELITEKAILLDENFIEKTVKVKGYIYEVDNSNNNVYIISIKEDDTQKTQ